MSITMSGPIMELARTAYHMCILDRDRYLSSDDNNLSMNALTVFFLTATALEAFINEVSFFQFHWLKKKPPISRKKVEKMNIRQKYDSLPQIFWAQTFEINRPPYQDFNMLIELRNAHVHYKMEELGTHETPKYLSYLRGKNLLYANDKPDDYFIPTPQYCNSKAALWAYNTACQMATGLIELSDAKTKNFWQPVVLSNFREIPELYWRSLVSSSK